MLGWFCSSQLVIYILYGFGRALLPDKNILIQYKNPVIQSSTCR